MSPPTSILASSSQVGGGWAANLAALKSKSVRRTQTLLSWCTRAVPVTLAERLWHIYVEPAVLMASQAGRQNYWTYAELGLFPRSSPPAVLAELGWMPWSVHYTLDKSRFMAVIACSCNALIKVVLDHMSRHEVTRVLEAIKPLECVNLVLHTCEISPIRRRVSV